MLRLLPGTAEQRLRDLEKLPDGWAENYGIPDSKRLNTDVLSIVRRLLTTEDDVPTPNYISLDYDGGLDISWESLRLMVYLREDGGVQYWLTISGPPPPTQTSSTFSTYGEFLADVKYFLNK
jgi:hypothetical protein